MEKEYELIKEYDTFVLFNVFLKTKDDTRVFLCKECLNKNSVVEMNLNQSKKYEKVTKKLIDDIKIIKDNRIRNYIFDLMEELNENMFIKRKQNRNKKNNNKGNSNKNKFARRRFKSYNGLSEFNSSKNASK